MSIVKKVAEFAGVGLIATTLLYHIGNQMSIDLKYRHADVKRYSPDYLSTQWQSLYDIDHDGIPDVAVTRNVAAGGVLGSGMIITSSERKPTETEIAFYKAH